jgi:hypothetical protein
MLRAFSSAAMARNVVAPFARNSAMAAQAAGAESLQAIAAELDRQHIPTPRGSTWTATAVRRLLAQIEG